MKNIENQMATLRLHGMAQAMQTLAETRRHLDLSFMEGLEVLLQAEQQQREQNRFERLRKNARFRYQASVEELYPDASRGLGKDQLTTLARGDYLEAGEAVIITGATGCGKSFIASALGHQACRQGYKVAYFNVQKLMQKVKIARLEGTIHKFFEKMAKIDLIILDDFGLAPLARQQQLDIMELIEDRHGRKSTILASQLPVANWFDIMGEATIADAILDRLVHTSHRIELKGESLRKKNKTTK
jgi:DNA replication protein DnaC